MKNIGSVIAEYFRLSDKWLLLFSISASALSILFLNGIKYAELLPSNTKVVSTQVLASALGIVVALIISLFDYHTLLKLWKLYVPVCLLLVGLTFMSGIATVRGDNQAWLRLQLGSVNFSIQPAELLKLSFIATFSMHIAKVKENINSLPNILLLCLHGGAHILLIQMQGDTGTALIFLAVFAAMIFCAGINWRYIVVAAVGVAAAVPLLWLRVMSEDQKMRILVLWNPELSEKYTWQQNQALNAMVYGGMQGNGIFNHSHRYVYVAEAYNDFIFSFIGEAAGFVGCLGVIILLTAISFKVLYNSRIARDDEGRFICIGVFAMLVSQILINLGMALGLLPVIGVTLPLLSAGGSSVVVIYSSLGFVLSVYHRAKIPMFFEREK